MLILSCSCNPTSQPAAAIETPETGTSVTSQEPFATISRPAQSLEPKEERNVYTNEKYGYSVSYPGNWYPTGIAYANAFEIRNYVYLNPASVPEVNRAALIIVDTLNDTDEATTAFLDNLLQADASESESLTIDGRRAVRVQKQVSQKQLAPGAAASSGSTATPAEPGFYYSISTYIANGKNLIAIEATLPAQADHAVLTEIYQISDSVKFR